MPVDFGFQVKNRDSRGADEQYFSTNDKQEQQHKHPSPARKSDPKISVIQTKRASYQMSSKKQ